MECTVRWTGDGMTFLAETGSKHVVAMDGAPEGGGRDLAPRPMEMVLVGTGGCTARDAGASAFALYEQGVSGLGNSYAGAAAVSEDATTVWWNPAGMAWLPAGKHIAGAAAFIDPSTKFSDRGSVAAAGRPLGGTGG